MDTVETANSGISFAHVFWPEFAVCWNLNKYTANFGNLPTEFAV